MAVVPGLTPEASIKRQLRQHFRSLGLSPGKPGPALAAGTKDDIRRLHAAQRHDLLRKEEAFIASHWPSLSRFFANGVDVVPTQIRPQLQLVTPGSEASKLFRLASLTWSVPVSRGYGRRLRFLLWDKANQKLIGLIGLTDPVFNLRARDGLIGWSAAERAERLVNILDANILGAVPPYNMLLGGKLLAALLRTTEMRDAFAERYGARAGIISGNAKKPQLVMITTASALGRSAVYNRVRLERVNYLQPVGFTTGWGHFHVSDKLFHLLRELLYVRGHAYAKSNRFGDGPSWKLRVIREGLRTAGVSPHLLRHGVERQVFVCELASNALDYLNGRSRVPEFGTLLSAEGVSRLAIDRWMIPRSQRDPSYKGWVASNIAELLQVTHSERSRRSRSNGR
jgi:hypothetical protein